MEKYITNCHKTSEKADSETLKKQIQKQTRNSHFVDWGDLGRENMKCFLKMKKTVL